VLVQAVIMRSSSFRTVLPSKERVSGVSYRNSTGEPKRRKGREYG
jgi:hypothetical protein